jgi:hypothetical protein
MAAAPPAAPAGPRIRIGELISAASALMLAAIMFGLEWFGAVGLPRSRRSGIETDQNAWHMLTVTRWFMLTAIAVALGSVVLHATQRSHGTKTDTGGVTVAVGTVTAALLAYQVLIDLPGSSSVVDIKIGAYLGLLAAIGIALGGWDSVREERARRGGTRRVRRPRRVRRERAREGGGGPRARLFSRAN